MPFGHQILKPGAFVSFTYNAPRKPKPGEIINVNKEIMVLNPNWQNQVHGIDLKRLTPAQVDVLRLIMDPETKNDPSKMNKYPLVADVMRRMEPTQMITNPVAFYSMFVKPFLRGVDAYRKYWPDYMYNLKVIEQSKVEGIVTNPKPLFRK